MVLCHLRFLLGGEEKLVLYRNSNRFLKRRQASGYKEQYSQQSCGQYL